MTFEDMLDSTLERFPEAWEGAKLAAGGVLFGGGSTTRWRCGTPGRRRAKGN